MAENDDQQQSSLARARELYSHISNAKKREAGLDHPDHKGRRVIPVLPSTKLSEVHDAVLQEEVVILATVMGKNHVEFGRHQVTADAKSQPTDATVAPEGITVEELIAMAKSKDGYYPQ